MTRNILVTGKNSYIGTSFINYCKRHELDFKIDELDLHGEEWKKVDFSKYDVIFHVAGIAHNSSSSSQKEMYYQVNTHLTLEVAEKAKTEGVSQFVFMSSIIVFGNNSDKNTRITPGTPTSPDNFYGDSKVQAEIGLEKLKSREFKVAILRPPMIYGKESKGNYRLLSKLARITPVFPEYENNRSMLYIDNLCELIHLIIINDDYGFYYPQNAELVQTSRMVCLIAKHHHHKIWFTKIGNPLIKYLFKVNLVRKVFGDVYYVPSMSQHYEGKYQLFNLEESIYETEVDK